MFSLANSSVKNILVHWILERELVNCASEWVTGNLIDIGCGTKPYQNIFKEKCTSQIGIDHPYTLHDTSSIDVFSTAYDIPFQNETFDTAIATAVLEHLEEPEVALRDCFRILKIGGMAIFSVPFIWHLHEEPRDFYRYSKYGLEYLFKKVGFEIVEIKPLSGFWVTFGQMFVYNIFRLNKGPIRWLHLLDIPVLIIQFFAYILDQLDKTEQWTWMYMVVVRKL